MSTELGEHYKKMRTDRGMTRRQVQEATGVTQGKLARIEQSGTFKDDERERLDALYGQPGDPGNDREKPSQTPLENYVRLYHALPEESRAEWHARALAGFPGGSTLEEIWAQASEQQRTRAVEMLAHLEKAEDAAPGRNLEEMAADAAKEQDPELDDGAQPDPTGEGRHVGADGRAWVMIDGKWRRDEENDQPAPLGRETPGLGGNVEFHQWFGLVRGDRCTFAGDDGEYKFMAYVVPARGPAYAQLWGGKGGQRLNRTVAPERVRDAKGRPLFDVRYVLGRTETGQGMGHGHAVPYVHHPVNSSDGQPLVKARCGAWVDNWSDTPWPSENDPMPCERCGELIRNSEVDDG